MENLLESKFYKYKDNYYKPLGIVKMKCPINGKWKVAVRYKKATESTSSDYGGMKVVENSPEYVREYDDFISKFECS